MPEATVNQYGNSILRKDALRTTANRRSAPPTGDSIATENSQEDAFGDLLPRLRTERMISERFCEEWRNGVSDVPFLVCFATMEDEAVVKRLKSRSLPDSDRSLIAIVSKSFGNWIRKIGRYGKPNSL